jgi:hypothetical protein
LHLNLLKQQQQHSYTYNTYSMKRHSGDEQLRMLRRTAQQHCIYSFAYREPDTMVPLSAISKK